MKSLIVILLVAFVAAEQKREAEPSYGIVRHGYGLPLAPAYAVGHRYGLGYGYGPAVAHHPYGGHSYVQSYNHIIHKREAEAEPGYGYGHGYGISHGYGYGLNHGYGYGYRPAVAYHPYGGHSFVHSRIHKREAEPSYGIPVYGHGHGAVYGYRTSIQHPGYAHSYQYNHGVVPAHYGHSY